MENKEENIENSKEKNNSVLIIVIMAIIIVALIGIIIYINRDNLFRSNEEETTTENIVEEEKTTENDNLCFDSSLIKEVTATEDLFAAVYYYGYHYTMDMDSYINSVYVDGSLLVNDMDSNTRFTIAYNATNLDSLIERYSCYDENGLCEEMTSYIDEQLMKDAYELIFGEGSYKQVDSFSIGCTPYVYDSENQRYVVNSCGCGGSGVEGITETIIDTKTTDTTFTITTAIVMQSYSGESFTYYKDYEKTIKIDNSKISKYETDTDSGVESYIKANYSSLEQYTYTFNIVDGNYIYQGVTRTKSVK